MLQMMSMEYTVPSTIVGFPLILLPIDLMFISLIFLSFFIFLFEDQYFMLFLFSQIRLSSVLYCTFPAKVIIISRLRKKRCNIMFFFKKIISSWDFSWLFAFELCPPERRQIEDAGCMG